MCIRDRYILNPSFGLRTGWSIIKSMLDPETTEKIQFLKSSDFHVMLSHIPKNQLEQKWGGDVPDLQAFWPIRYTGKEPSWNPEQEKLLQLQKEKDQQKTIELEIVEQKKRQVAEKEREEQQKIYQEQERQKLSLIHI
eukprot:TRINITY_DN4875_c0_g1_i13.p1 TRINITY_DN4875_c0_g1~~TRINITY_DN4875_c0_g1_i13.p1  ORF type:complete len:138 (+),score=29.32 TRINITY_DN4875_c0_g1_i13:65-478(+)